MTGRIWRVVAAAGTVLGVLFTSTGPAGAGVSCTISINDAAVTEGDAGTSQLVFTVSKTGGTGTTIAISTADGTATGGSDYLASSSLIPVAPSTTSIPVSITVSGDRLHEPNETLFVNVSASGCLVTDNQGVGTIRNDDPLALSGYRLTALDGGLFAFGQSTYRGSANTIPGLSAPIVDLDETPDRSGYWQVGNDGGVFAWGGAPFFGSAASFALQEPVLGIAARPQNDGYWLVGFDGGVFAFGGAPFLGNAFSPGAAIVDIVSTPSGNGYWLLDAGGAVHAFGDAVHAGNYDAMDVEAVGMAAQSRTGYWIANVAGNVLPFGTAPFLGQIQNPESLAGSTTGIEATATGNGYWLVATDGGVFAFGDAPFYGSLGGIALDAPVVALAGRR